MLTDEVVTVSKKLLYEILRYYCTLYVQLLPNI